MATWPVRRIVHVPGKTKSRPHQWPQGRSPQQNPSCHWYHDRSHPKTQARLDDRSDRETQAHRKMRARLKIMEKSLAILSNHNQEASPPQPLVELMQCGKTSCGHVLIESEQVWVPNPEWKHSKTATCPKCGNDCFFSLNAQGQKRKMSDTCPRKIPPSDIQPSPRMGLKMRRRILAAKSRAIALLNFQRVSPGQNQPQQR